MAASQFDAVERLSRAMNERDDIEELAGEYVIGTLPANERAAISLRRQSDAALDAAIVRWEQRMAPLLEQVTPVEPPSGLFDKIQSKISDPVEVISIGQHRETVAQVTRPWRIATGAMTALAASLAGFILWTGPVGKPMSPKYVAVLQEESHTPAFLMTVDMKTHMCAIKTVVSPPKSGKNYELWMVHDTFDQPKSLGLIAKNDMEVMPMASDIDPDLYMNATFAVSLEPAGGSPTGKPTGPVMYAGRLVQSIP